ncbi:hypothetical protein [Pseudomonas mediterranea]|uniref:hypothetical protein n=1 Tax=Pseudomonas mediterranea TaxID=183795 RepID=UPI001D4EBBC1|nr:hypothetical protein [Pseudomonas mediterranea]CAH0167936.1 hypothetical protein SRABI112_01098 [Pseudomonas mediterranea]
MQWFYVFIKPYYWMSFIASYGVAQNLEGVGWFGYFNSIYEPGIPYPLLNLSPVKGVKIISLLFFIFVAFMSLIFVRGAFVLGRKAGWVSISLVFLPGFLSLIGFSPSWWLLIPEEFRLGAGYIGGFWSSGINFLLAFVFGWSAVLMLANLFKSQKFKHVYDHLWCMLSLVGCMYLVVDSQAKSDREQMLEVNKLLGDYLQFYKVQYKNLNEYCLVGASMFKEEKKICSSAAKVSSILSSNTVGDEPEVRRYGDFWLSSLPEPSDIAEINTYMCSRTSLSGACVETPLNLMVNSQELGGKVYIPLPDHGERVRKLYEKLGRLVDKVKLAREHENLKYFLFCMISFLAGGKAATASLSLIGEGNMKSRSWILSIVRLTFFNSWFFVRLVVR